LYVREGLGKQWYETLLDVAGEAGAAVTEAYGGKMAGDAVRAGHKIWTGLAFKDNQGGGGAPRPPPPPPAPARDPRTGLMLGPRPGPPGAMPAPPPPWRPRPKKKKKQQAMAKKTADAAPAQGPATGPVATAPVEAGILGGDSSKGMLIFGVISAVAIGAYLLMQQKKPTTPHEPRP
jgi:hypothetical protein